MAMSGVTVSDECVQAYQKLQQKRAHRFVLMGIEGTEVKVRGVSEPSASYDDFRAAVGDQPTYIIYDFEWEAEGAKKSKVLFISYIPDNAKVKEKMLYASTKESVKQAIGGGVIEIQATAADEISVDALMAKVK